MFHKIIISKLEDNLKIFNSLFLNISTKQARWKLSETKWSMLEALNHLLDEEVDDFRQRIEFALLKPERIWKQVAPEKWVSEKNYNEKDLIITLNNFKLEREKSISFLTDLTFPDWHALDNYPYGKTLTAEQILVNWLAHDYLHMRQITKLNWDYLSKLAPSLDLAYAGNW
jgi:DinB superfamily